MKNFKELQVWHKAHAPTLHICNLANGFPREKLSSLTSQLRLSAVSIPSSIAEGCGRGGNADLGRFLEVTRGSASEVEDQLLLVLGYLPRDQDDEGMASISQEVKRLIASFFQTLREPGLRQSSRSALLATQDHES